MTDHVQCPQPSQHQAPTALAPPICCELFIETLNQNVPNIGNSPNNQPTSEAKEPTGSLSFSDVVSFLGYCQIWQVKQCVCVFTNEDLLAKFHHFLHTIIATSIQVIRHFPQDFAVSENDEYLNVQENRAIHPARLWTLDEKEKLLVALVKTFSLNMPLYVTYKHLLFNHGRYSRIRECSCANLSNDSIALVQIFCQANLPGTSQKIQVVISSLIVSFILTTNSSRYGTPFPPRVKYRPLFGGFIVKNKHPFI